MVMPSLSFPGSQITGPREAYLAHEAVPFATLWLNDAGTPAPPPGAVNSRPQPRATSARRNRVCGPGGFVGMAGDDAA